MKTIVIVEDNKIEAGHIESLLLTIEDNLEIHITGKATTALKLAKKICVDIFFIDIQLIDYDGFKLAQQIRILEHHVLTPIVFITGVKDRELIGYKNYHCYEYIIKPYTKDEFIETISKLLLTVQPKDERLRFKQKGYTYIIKLRNIFYIDILKRKITIHTMKGNVSLTNKTLTEIRKMAPKTLIQVHQSFLVNKNYVERIMKGENIIYFRGCKNPIPIGRKYLNNVKRIEDDSN